MSTFVTLKQNHKYRWFQQSVHRAAVLLIMFSVPKITQREMCLAPQNRYR